jgi:hypothetical protein
MTRECQEDLSDLNPCQSKQHAFQSGVNHDDYQPVLIIMWRALDDYSDSVLRRQ